MNYFMRVIVLVALALVAYALPWIANPGTGLTMGAYDLAEWASIHPANRTASPTLLTTLLLRLPLVLLVFTLVLASQKYRRFSGEWWLVVVSLAVFVLATLPPLEFITENRHDPNYRQQAILALAVLLGGGLGLIRALRWRYAAGLLLLLLGLAVTCSWIGTLQAFDLMVDLRMPSELGPGIYIFSLSSIIMMADTFVQQKRANPT